VTDHVRIARGNLYLDHALCERYFEGISSVAMLLRDGQVLMLPLRGPAAGGLLLKIRNIRGDRVVHADEFLRSLGIPPEAPECAVAIQWLPEAGGLLLDQVTSRVAGSTLPTTATDN